MVYFLPLYNFLKCSTYLEYYYYCFLITLFLLYEFIEDIFHSLSILSLYWDFPVILHREKCVHIHNAAKDGFCNICRQQRSHIHLKITFVVQLCFLWHFTLQYFYFVNRIIPFIDLNFILVFIIQLQWDFVINFFMVPAFQTFVVKPFYMNMLRRWVRKSVR